MGTRARTAYANTGSTLFVKVVPKTDSAPAGRLRNMLVPKLELHTYKAAKGKERSIRATGNTHITMSLCLSTLAALYRDGSEGRKAPQKWSSRSPPPKPLDRRKQWHQAVQDRKGRGAPKLRQQHGSGAATAKTYLKPYPGSPCSTRKKKNKNPNAHGRTQLPAAGGWRPGRFVFVREEIRSPNENAE